jgi:hypothetical protein
MKSLPKAFPFSTILFSTIACGSAIAQTADPAPALNTPTRCHGSYL